MEWIDIERLNSFRAKRRRSHIIQKKQSLDFLSSAHAHTDRLDWYSFSFAWDYEGISLCCLKSIVQCITIPFFLIANQRRMMRRTNARKNLDFGYNGNLPKNTKIIKFFISSPVPSSSCRKRSKSADNIRYRTQWHYSETYRNHYINFCSCSI